MTQIGLPSCLDRKPQVLGNERIGVSVEDEQDADSDYETEQGANQDQSDEEEDSNQAEECRKNRKEGAVEEILPQGPQGPLCSHSAAPGLTLHRSVHDSRPLQPRDDGPSTDD